MGRDGCEVGWPELERWTPFLFPEAFLVLTSPLGVSASVILHLLVWRLVLVLQSRLLLARVFL